MSTPEITRPQGMPAYLATQFEIGIETGLGDDRLLALQLANEFDTANDAMPSLGLRVVEAYMQQRNHKFDMSIRPRRHASWRKILETSRTANMVTAVSQAISSTIAVETIVHELVDGLSHTVAITQPGVNPDISLLSSVTETDIMEIDVNRPYFVYQRFLRNASFANFHKAMYALADNKLAG